MDLRISFYFLILGGVGTLVLSQIPLVPSTITNCYENSTAYNRYTRQPMHIENLIAIIKKIEDKTDNLWTTRRIARTILKQFQFDGLRYDPFRKQGLRFETDDMEDHRTLIVRGTIAGTENIPDGVLDNDDKCALHWMLSHSINATLREDEVSRQTNLRARRSVEGNQDNDTDFEVELEDSSDEASGSHKVTTVSPKFKKITTTKAKKPANNENVDYVENIAMDSDYQADAEHLVPGMKFARQSGLPTTKQPIETGIVYTKWGSISAGRLIAGIAAGLETVTTPVSVTSVTGYSGGVLPNNNAGLNNNGNGYLAWGQGVDLNRGNNGNNGNNVNSRGQPWGPSRNDNARYKRQTSGGNDYLTPINNIYSATLAGDVGQAAIINAVYDATTNESPPTGYFNDSICPREYIMDSLSNPSADVSHKHDTWSYMTSAEIRGGVDGLVLGLQMRTWDDRHDNLRLSTILAQYYGADEKGIVDDPAYRACNRGSLYANYVNPSEVLEQSKSFAYLYNNKSSLLTVATMERIDYIYKLVQDTYTKMSGHISTITSTDTPCKRREAVGTDIPEADKIIPPKATVYAVLDQTDTESELLQQKRFVAQLAFDLNVSPLGSRLGLVNGASGQLLIKPNFTDNPSVLACRIVGERAPVQSTIGILSALTTIEGELQRVRDDEIRYNYTDSNGIAVLVFNQGKKMDDNLKSEVKTKLQDLENKFGDVHVTYVTSKYQASDYEDVVLNKDYDVIRIQSSSNLSSETAKFTQEFVKRHHARLTYPQCNKNVHDQTEEHKIATDLFISPNTIQYYKISPDYYFSAVTLQLRFTSDNGKVRVCVSRSNRFPNSQNTGEGSGVDCYETSGQYQGVESKTADLEIPYNKPCGGNGKRDGCKPIYLSITPISFPVAGSVGFDCSVDKCQYSDQVKVTFSHWDMRCNSNGAVHTVISSPGLFLALLMAVVTFTRNS